MNNKIKCKNCGDTRYKIVYTHGRKSPGYKVCKRCGELIK